MNQIPHNAPAQGNRDRAFKKEGLPAAVRAGERRSDPMEWLGTDLTVRTLDPCDLRQAVPAEIRVLSHTATAPGAMRREQQRPKRLNDGRPIHGGEKRTQPRR